MKSIRLRFIAISLAGVTVALALAFWFFVTLFAANLEARIDQEQTGHLNRLAGSLSFEPNGQLKKPQNPADNRFETPYSGLYWQIEDDSRSVQFRSPSLFDYALPLPADDHEAGAVHRYRLAGPESTELIVQERIVLAAAPDGARSIRIAVAENAATLNKATSDFGWTILPYVTALALLLAALSGLQLGFGLKPLVRLTGDLKSLQDRRTSRLKNDYPSELQPLVNEVNGLLDAREKQIQRARERAADLAHGLKTPLTVLANDALKLSETGNPEMGRELEHLADTMLAHVDHELARSRLTMNPAQRRSDANLLETLNPLIKTLQHMPKGSEVAWSTSVADTIILPVDPNDLRELLGNILENAAKWAAGSVSVSALRSGESWIISVEDDGPGVPPEKVDMLTERGLRLDSETPGTGLGLAIVKEVAEAYETALTFENRKPTGLRVTLAVPAKL